MRLTFRCPECRKTALVLQLQPGDTLRCSGCGWQRVVPPQQMDDDNPKCCLVCGCDDLWRQKDFPQRVGVAMVAVGAILSTVAWAWMRPGWAIGILMFFALIDLLLFAWMPDVLVCYRCGTRHSPGQINESFEPFQLETAERYRQESLRLENSTRSS